MGCPPSSQGQNYRTPLHKQQRNRPYDRNRACFQGPVAQMARHLDRESLHKPLFCFEFFDHANFWVVWWRTDDAVRACALICADCGCNSPCPSRIPDLRPRIADGPAGPAVPAQPSRSRHRPRRPRRRNITMDYGGRPPRPIPAGAQQHPIRTGTGPVRPPPDAGSAAQCPRGITES